MVGANLNDDAPSASTTVSSGPLGGDPNSQATQQVDAPRVRCRTWRPCVAVSGVDRCDGGQSKQGEGSGVVLSEDGVIMTNNHVVSLTGTPADNVQVNFSDGTSARAKVLGTDPISDIAVLKADKVGSAAHLGGYFQEPGRRSGRDHDRCAAGFGGHRHHGHHLGLKPAGVHIP